ncbi:D-arabinose 1-dehydrogenase (NAD(P)(+)) [Martiniozyma asiatica (nom. inval.)]|nr:D-arabinose 1-dehydrogenase (NAD(P)(+)) [Martiniozyma asiatica]
MSIALPPLIVGGAVFNSQYNENPEDLPITALLEKANKLGINALDTSPYYGPSEVLLGKSLGYLFSTGAIDRSKYFICTKVGRIQLEEFDYSPQWVNTSIHRSLKRLNTEYLDVVFLHDVEFQTQKQSLEALAELMRLKNEGIIKNVGISGYPVEYLCKLAIECVKAPDVGKLDIIMSYCNMCLQNTTLEKYHDRFLNEAQVKLVNNASILSMSMLTANPTRSFHPASKTLKGRVDELAIQLKEKFNEDLAELSTRFALREWTAKGKGSTVLGLSSVAELDSAFTQWEFVTGEKSFEQEKKDLVMVKFARDFLGSHLNETWSSGIDHS